MEAGLGKILALGSSGGPKKKLGKGKIALIVIGAILVLGAIGNLTSTPSSTSGLSSGNPTTEPPATTPGIGTPVEDGSFRFVIHSVSCGQSSIGSGFTSATAQGQFCTVKLSVENIKDSSQTFDASSQYLFDVQGRKYDTSSDAIFALPDSNSFLEDVNPGNRVEGEIAFDIPAGDSADHLELHDSPFSGGVTVKV